jgi:hypothetical protein
MIFKNEILGLDTWNMEQGTGDWLKARAGVITASVADVILMDNRKAPFPDDLEIIALPGRGNNKVVFNGEEHFGTKVDCTDWVRSQLPEIIPEMKTGYLYYLAGQVCTGLVCDSTPFKQAEWGHENEPFAREAYEASTMQIVEQCGFIYKDETMRCGISPDGIIDLKKGLEIKNPFTTEVHIATAIDGKIKPEYVTQCQYSMWVTGFDEWDFCSYDHRMRGDASNRLCIIKVKRDPEMMKKFDDKIPAFIGELDKVIAHFGFKFGDQWREF